MPPLLTVTAKTALPKIRYNQDAHSSSVNSVAFSPDGKTALSGSGQIFSTDNTVKWWDLSSGSVIKSLDAHSKVNSVAFSPDGKTALSGLDNTTIRFWNLETGEEILQLGIDKSFSKGVTSLFDDYDEDIPF